MRDQVVAMGYLYYVVVACKISVSASVNAVSPNATMLVGIRANSDGVSDAGSDSTVQEERQLCRYWKVSLAKPVKMVVRQTTGEVLGVDQKQVLDQYTCIAGVGGNPPQGWYWNLNVQDSDHATTTSAVNMEVTLDYSVRFMYTNPVGQS